MSSSLYKSKAQGDPPSLVTEPGKLLNKEKYISKRANKPRFSTAREKTAWKRLFFTEEVCTVMRVSLEEEEWRDGCDPTEQSKAWSSQNKGKVWGTPTDRRLQKTRRAIAKKLRWWPGRRTEETRRLAEEQQLPKTQSNDWVFDQRGSKNLTPKSEQGHVSAASLREAGIARGDGNRPKGDSKAFIFPLPCIEGVRPGKRSVG